MQGLQWLQHIVEYTCSSSKPFALAARALALVVADAFGYCCRAPKAATATATAMGGLLSVYSTVAQRASAESTA